MKAEFEVIEIRNEQMTLKPIESHSCNSCSASGACGTGVLSKYFSSFSTLNKPVEGQTQVGDKVVLEIAPGELFWRAFQLYILPIVALFVAAYLAKSLFSASEITQILSGLLAFLSTILLLKYVIK